MAQDRAISGHTSLAGANLAAGDLFEVVDVSDPTDAATGTNKKMTATELATGVGSQVVVARTFANDGNYTVPRTERVAGFYDRDTGVRIGGLLVGHTGIGTDFFGWAFYGLDDVVGVQQQSGETFLFGVSGYGTLATVGDIVTGWDGTVADNQGNYLKNATYVGIGPLTANPQLAQLYVQYSANADGSPAMIVDFRDAAGVAAFQIDPSRKVFLPGLPTSDPHAAGQLWNSGGTLKVSAG
jgi:hypothetical protein